MASSTIPIGIPSEHPMPQTSFYEYSDYSAFSDSDQFSHLDYSPQYPQTPGSMPSSYHMYPYGGSNGSPPTYGPPSPKAFKRSMSMSGVGPNLDFGNTSPPTPAASTSGSNVGGPTAGGDRAFRQILSQITRIQTNLSQQHFSLMDVAEKQGKIQDKLKMLEARSDSVNDEVTKVLENTDCIVDDVKDMKERVESQHPVDDSIRDALDDQAERIDRLIEEVKTIKLSVEALQATSVANVRGLPATEEEDEDEDDEEKMQVALPAPSVGDLKSFLSSEIKDIVKAQVRSEMKALKSTMTSELKELRKLYKAREKETERNNPRSPPFSPEALVAFDDNEVTKYLIKYGFDAAWVNSMNESQKKRMLAGYLGQSYRDALQRPPPLPIMEASESSDDSDSSEEEESGDESDTSS